MNLRILLFTLLIFTLLFLILSCGQGTTQKNGKGELINYDIKGIVKLSGETDHSGTAIFVGGTQIVAYTDENGEFLIQGLEKGTYQLYAQKSGYTQERFKKLFLNTKDKIVDAGIVTLDPLTSAKVKKSFISGKVTLSDATDFTDIIVSLDNTDYQTTTDSSGLFLIKGIEPALYTITFKKDGYKPFSDMIEIKEGENLRFSQVTLQPMSADEKMAVKMMSTISEKDGRTIAGYVILNKLDGSTDYNFVSVRVKIEEINYITRTDSEGNFYFSYLNPGKYKLSAELESYKLKEIVGVDVTDSDVKNVILILQEKEPEQKFGALNGKAVLEGEEDSTGIVVIIPGTNFYATTGADGIFRFKEVPYGSYNLIAKKEGYDDLESDKFDIDQTGEIDVGELYLEKSVDYPYVVYTDPADNSDIQVKRNITLFVKFSKRMNIDSVKSALSIAPEVAYTSFMGREGKESDFDLLQIVLKGNDVEKGLRFNKLYSIKVSTNAKDFEGNNLREDYIFRFKTGKPSIIDTFPKNGAKDFYFSPNEPVRILFNAPMNHTSVRNSIRFSPELEYVPSIDILDSVGDGWTEARVNYTWKPDTKYTVTIDKKAVTINKEILSNTPYKLTFTTGKSVSFEEIKDRSKRF